jgi:hypothetical protein
LVDTARFRHVTDQAFFVARVAKTGHTPRDSADA